MPTILFALRPRRDARLRGDADGFSLIELMVVLLIIAILLAVAIPTYLSARNRAENRAAQETIAHTFVTAKADYASQDSFTPLGSHTTLAGRRLLERLMSKCPLWADRVLCCA